MKKIFKFLGGATFVVALAFNFNLSEAKENDGDGDGNKKVKMIVCYNSSGTFYYGNTCIPGTNNCIERFCY